MTSSVVALRHLVTCLDGRRIPLNSEQRSYMDGQYPYWGAGSIVDHIDRYLFDEELVLLGEDGAPFFDHARNVAFRVNQRVWVNNHIHVLRPAASVDARYLTYALNVVDYGRYIGGSTRDKLTQDDMREIEVPSWPVGQQRRIADFLDDQVARIDNIIAARHSQRDLLAETETRAAWDALTAPELTGRRATGLGWLPSVPSSWPMTTVQAAYSVMLGKMLDESKFTGAHTLPYLRNTNVQWDRISTDDLKAMDFAPDERERFSVHAGDLLICEGGQPGRCAVWDGSISPIGYQKALHRARPRGDSDVRWLQLMLRVAVSQNTFAVEFGQATIGHLTGEQLRSLRILMPPLAVQRSRSDRFAHVQNDLHSLSGNLATSIERLEEFKRSLITAAVTGEFDVSSADGSRVAV